MDGSRRADVSQEGERRVTWPVPEQRANVRWPEMRGKKVEAGQNRFSEKGSTKDEVEPGMMEK